MEDQEIQTRIDKIYHEKTREYFLEVYATYINNNYRSATVMLFAVLICDLVYKLRELRDLSSDPLAINILKEIEQMQTKNPTSPDWESKLINEIKSKTSLIESSSIAAIESLHKFRHLSAHPVLSDLDILYSPNKDIVRGLVIAILDGVLTNPPYYSRKIFDLFIMDLSNVNGKFSSIDDLEKYLTAKYFLKMKEPVMMRVFRNLWRIYITDYSKEANENRNINKQALKIIYNKYSVQCESEINKNKAYYSNISRTESIDFLIQFLFYAPSLYKHLASTLLPLIDSRMKESSEIRFMSYFTSESLAVHLNNLDVAKVDDLPFFALESMMKRCEAEKCTDVFIDFLVTHFGESKSYYQSNLRYNREILPFYSQFNKEHVNKLLRMANANGQIRGTYDMRDKLLKIAEMYPDIDLTPYPYFDCD